MLLFNGLTPSLKLGPSICNFIIKWTSWPTILSLGAVDIMLVIRVLAIYGYKKKIIWLLSTLYAVTLIPWITLAILLLTKTTSTPSEGTLFTGCLDSAPSYFFAAWIPPAFFESVLIYLTLYQTFQYEKVNPTLRVVARDSIIYFVIIFAMLLANIFIARFGKGFLGALLIVPCSVTACIAVARMTMNMRTIAPEVTEQSTWSYQDASLEFRCDDTYLSSKTKNMVKSTGTLALEVLR